MSGGRNNLNATVGIPPIAYDFEGDRDGKGENEMSKNQASNIQAWAIILDDQEVSRYADHEAALLAKADMVGIRDGKHLRVAGISKSGEIVDIGEGLPRPPTKIPETDG